MDVCLTKVRPAKLFCESKIEFQIKKEVNYFKDDAQTFLKEELSETNPVEKVNFDGICEPKIEQTDITVEPVCQSIDERHSKEWHSRAHSQKWERGRSATPFI